MTNFNDSQHPREDPRHGGRFSAKPHTSPEAELPATPAFIEHDVAATITLRTHADKPLPQLPSELQPSTTTWSFGEPGDRVFTSFTVGDDGPDAVSVTVWTDEDGDGRSSIEDQSEETGWDPEDDDKFLEYAYVVHDRIDANVQAAKHALFGGAVSGAIVQSVVG